MFKSLIYFDSNKIAEYGALLEGKKHLAIKNVKVNSEKGIKGQVSILSGEINGNKEMEGVIVENLLLDCNEFEELLERKGKDFYFDFLSKDYDSETILKTSIIRFEGRLKIPTDFDTMDLINEFKPMLVSSMNVENPQNEEFINKFFAKESTKIPAFLESDNFEERIGFSKLNSNGLLHELEHMEDIEDEEVTIIAKVLSRKNMVNNKPIIVFDVMKDFFSLGRGIRRQVGDKGLEGVPSIQSDKNLILLEVLAIYQ